MNADLEHLIVLQAQDLDLTRLRSELAEAPRRVRAAEAALGAATAVMEKTRSALAAEEKLRRGQESEAATLREKQARLRRSLEGASSTAQVTAFEKEIQFAASAIAGLEDEELASMERSELLADELTRADAGAAQRQRELEIERERASHTTLDSRARIAGIELQRNALRQEIEEATLSVYDRLSKAKGSALAEALGSATQGKCSACQMSVRPQRWQDLIGREHDDQIFSCESCGRMLFWDPRRDTPKAWEAGERLRQAQTGSAR